jgi:hypothetical protein
VTEASAIRPFDALPGPAAAARAGAAPADERLREACGEFAGMLLGILLKEGLTPHAMGGEDEPPAPGSEMMLEAAVEQTARAMGHSGAMGLRDMLYEQMAGGPVRAAGPRGTP